jgi:peptide-methionine (R)-S-oxide reductase
MDMRTRSFHTLSFFFSIFLLMSSSACSQAPGADEENYKVEKTKAEWRAELTPLEFDVIRNKGTEKPFTGDLLDNKKEGTYVCRACQHPLFESETKFKSGTGWPSFYDEIPGHVKEEEDRSFGMTRVEVVCDRCGGHLGHVFKDGPEPTGLRYCINSVSLDFIED